MTAQEIINIMLSDNSEQSVIETANAVIKFYKDIGLESPNDWQGVLDILQPKKLENITKGDKMNTNPQTTTTPTKFWMVKTGTSGNSSANIHHATKEIAMEECQRIAKQQPNKKVYLLEVISCFEVIDIPVKEIKL
jgi:hypothetical protein